MRLSYSIIFSIFYTISPVQCLLKCFSGHSQFATQCTSQSYCVSITSKNGPVQRSCDGNSISQISLCSQYAMHGIPRTITTDYSNFPVLLGGAASQDLSLPQTPAFPAAPISKMSGSTSRSSRRAPVQMCFNAGDLGDVCCCNTDWCNSSRLQKYVIIIVFPIVLLFYGL
ncbi:Protein CBG05618 [Caenorhabditis briggsae]|uniref:Protein CBG05618 n=1 Tax=Caenorhabditis briggsae TaxID=6238 RepID=A8X0A0_CAEBR|nr:Protein CBG05618 [Caenorhabditis briggsae]CAP26060.2 Protein CBG05618 [Caenorhabditis briggsae]